MALARWIFGALCLFLMGGAAFVVAMDENRAAYAEPVKVAPMAGSVIKLTDQRGHGSGVHIGGGYVVSAAHVTRGKTQMAYIRDDGKKGSATVLWWNDDNDISLLKIDTTDGIEASNLSCRMPEVGEAVSLRGNPLDMEHITTWGRVSGKAFKAGPWAVVVPVNAAIAGGMSGGGMFDSAGNLIGINVGMPLQPIGYGATAVGIAVIVPGEVVCSMLARSA